VAGVLVKPSSDRVQGCCPASVALIFRFARERDLFQLAWVASESNFLVDCRFRWVQQGLAPEGLGTVS
jgi:hypothetical protein